MLFRPALTDRPHKHVCHLPGLCHLQRLSMKQRAHSGRHQNNAQQHVLRLATLSTRLAPALARRRACVTRPRSALWDDSMTLTDLRTQLEAAIDNEEYELAARIRDTLQ